MLTVMVLDIAVFWLNQISLQEMCKFIHTYSVRLIAEFTTNAAIFLNKVKSLTCIIKFEVFFYLVILKHIFVVSIFFNRAINLK
jgi:hypothetical protein